MQFKHFSLLCLFLILVAGCEKDSVYENIYEGLQKREQIVNPSNDPSSQEQQSYDAYKREREENLNNEDVELEHQTQRNV